MYRNKKDKADQYIKENKHKINNQYRLNYHLMAEYGWLNDPNGFIKSIPVELEEAAMIDGATRFQTFWQIVFPIMKPITMTIVTLDMLWIWNDFLLPSLVLTAPNERTLQLSTYVFNGTYTTDYGLSMSALMLSVLPILIIYLFLQKSIIGGVLQGSIK